MITIEGYSGCHVCVRRGEGSSYVVEKSCSPSYVPRLKQQEAKQVAARLALNIDDIVVPEVFFGRSNADGGYTVGMKFYHHHDAVTYISSCNVQQIWDLTRIIQTFLSKSVELCVEGGAPQSVPASVLKDKIVDVVKVLEANSIVNSMDDGIVSYVRETVAPALVSIIDSKSEDGCIRIPVGHCHGDLTLSNILLTHDEGVGLKVILIDFLDSFIESPLADTAKLFQDLKFGWTLRLLLSENASDSINPLSVFTSMEYMMNQIESQFQKFEWFRSFHSVFLVLNQLRVLQYSKNPEVARYLVQTVKIELAKLI